MKKTNKVLAMLLAIAMVGTLLVGCKTNGGTTNTATPTTEPTAAPTETVEATETPTPTEIPVETLTYSEAPVLAEQVAAGTIPAVEDRIPDKDNIKVVSLDAAGGTLSIGTYGGVLNLALGTGSWDLSRPTLESIIRYNTDGSYSANVIKSYEVSDDFTVWTFHLREGMKWSDGEPFTADDITFWYYMVHTNNFDGKAKSWAALIDNETGNFAKLTKVDDYTVTWTFDTAKYASAFIENGDFKWCWAPAHYIKDLIPASYCTEDAGFITNDYWQPSTLTDEEALANAIAKGINYSTVKDLGKNTTYYFWNIPGIPTLNSYVLTAKDGNNNYKEDTLVIMERNAYYWKVDANGNQLPYIDELHFNKTENSDQQLLNFLSGELDVYGVAMKDISTTLESAGSAATLKTYAGTNWGSYQVTFNQTCKDEKYQQLFANADFRQAISICVDRSEFSELLSDGFLEPGQAAPSEGNFGYDEEWTNKWTEYDVAKAQSLLEACGLVKGSDGYYTFSDGTPVEIVFYTYTDLGLSSSAWPVLEKYYTALGLKVSNKDLEVSAFDQEIDNNDWQAVLGPHTAISGASLRSRQAPFVPIAQAAEWYGDYGTYYSSNGANGVAPTGDMAKLVELYEQWITTADQEKQDEIAQQIYDIHKANLWSIAYLKGENSYVVINSKIQNWADTLVWDDLYQYTNMVHYETLYKAE